MATNGKKKAISNRPMKYGYSDARIRGMKGTLLSRQFLEELVKAPGLKSLIELMERTPYKEDINLFLGKYDDAGLLEAAISTHFSRVATKVRKTVLDPDDRKAIDAMLARWALLNLKTMISAKRLGKRYDDVKQSLVPIGSLSEEEMRAIMDASEGSLMETIKRTDIGKRVFLSSVANFNPELMARFKQSLLASDNLYQVQLMIDATVHEILVNLVEESGNPDAMKILPVMRSEIDARNISIIYRLKSKGTDKARIREHLIRGGRLGPDAIDRIIDAKDVASLEGIVREKVFGGFSMKNDAGIVDLEIGLEKAIAKEKTRVFYRSMFSVGSQIGFLLLKEEESNNVRKIAKAKMFGVPEDEIREMLVFI
ncbi:MAG: V-type ATPase subunit [Candidatus Bilamarchaeaceae archaeon]